MRNRRWLGATALGLLGWPLEIVALLLAPLTVVQPCLASGLILLLWLGVTRLGEAPGRRECVAVAAIVAGVAGVAWAAPERTHRSCRHRGDRCSPWAWSRSRSPLPYLLRRPGRPPIGLLAVLSAGCGYAWTAIASKLLTDELAAGALLVAAAWLATAVASEGLALLSEMSALQRRPATHVAPVMFAVQVLVPVAAGAADLRRVVGDDARWAARRSSPSWRWRSPAPCSSPARGRSAAVIESAHEPGLTDWSLAVSRLGASLAAAH